MYTYLGMHNILCRYILYIYTSDYCVVCYSFLLLYFCFFFCLFNCIIIIFFNNKARGSNDVIIGGFHSVIFRPLYSNYFVRHHSRLHMDIYRFLCNDKSSLDQYNLSFTFNIRTYVINKSR